MTSDDLLTSLRQPYDRQTWTTLLRRVFGKHVRLESQPRSVSTGDDEAVRSIAQIGSVTLDDGRNLAVIEVEVSDSIMLLRNRVSLRNKVARFIDEDRAHGVLAVFSSSRPEYRFSFTARETIFDEQAGIVEKETATKRFTYVLGPGETCTTAAQRFEQLSTKRDSLNLGDVVEAFSVEKLNKEFFSSYREHYLRFCNHLLGDEARAQTYRIFGIRQVSSAPEQSRLEKPVRDFVKRLLGRIVFLHFIQKKGWMGCPADSHCWGGGDPDFLRNYFHVSTDKAAFHSGRLLPLFYEALNTPGRPHDVYAHTGTRIPYLNGGLFESVIPGEREIDFPSDYFQSLLDFFAQYNFTIDENDPDEHEVGIDPEMLGHIFENLLEDNKDKGAYYTPKAIVHYMCQQSLIYYLITHLGDTAESRAAVEFLVRNKQVGEGTPHGSYIRRNAARIESLLDTVKICDPAIGSGAFPIGLLQEIFWLKLTLDLTLNEPSRLAEIKRRIIQNSIYGVDKDAGAVSIARLRFWLSLVVDEEAPQPLPNLDFKIMQGDSLLESFEGIPLDQFDPESMGAVSISPQAQLEMDFASSQLPLASEEKVNRITELMRAYFTEDAPAEKVRLHGEIDRFVLDHIEFNLNYRKDELETELHQHRAEIAEKQKQLASFEPSKKEAKRMEWLQSGIAEIDRKKRLLSKLETEPERPYFLWHLFFQDVFERGGFDIVIANPPYAVKFSNERKSQLKVSYPTVPDYEIAYYFILYMSKLANDNSISCMIVPNTWLSNVHALKFRKTLLSDPIMVECCDCSNIDIFREATVRNSIVFLAKNKSLPQKSRMVLFSENSSLIKDSSLEYGYLELKITNWLTLFSVNKEIEDVLDKIRKTKVCLSNITDVSQGLIPYDKYRGHDKDTIDNRIWHSNTAIDNTYKKELKGKDVMRYAVVWNGETWISYGSWLAAPREPKFFTRPRLLFREITNPKIICAYTDCEFYNTPSIINATDIRDSYPMWLVSLFNSNALSFYHIQSSPKSKKGVFPKILVNDVRNLPIPAATDEQKSRLSGLAEAAAIARPGSKSIAKGK